MSKRVNITYSVEFEEIPEHVADLVNKTYNSLFQPLNNKFQDSLGTLKKGNEKEAAKTIDDIRQVMFKIDCCLGDCYTILKEYQHAQIVPMQEKEVESDEVG
tara:strand:+ start:606 stop:911 length:306 start_codon:yes stop_codon:yes gene_type:complete